MSAHPSFSQAPLDYPTLAAASLSEDLVPVLFIEDDPDLAEMYRIKLELDGYQVAVVEAGEISGAQAERVHPELIFLDIRAPHCERAQILKTLEQNRALKKVPVVILSDYSPQQLKDAGVSLQARQYLVLNFSAPASFSTIVDDWEDRF